MDSHPSSHDNPFDPPRARHEPDEEELHALRGFDEPFFEPFRGITDPDDPIFEQLEDRRFWECNSYHDNVKNVLSPILIVLSWSWILVILLFVIVNKRFPRMGTYTWAGIVAVSALSYQGARLWRRLAPLALHLTLAVFLFLATVGPIVIFGDMKNRNFHLNIFDYFIIFIYIVGVPFNLIWVMRLAFTGVGRELFSEDFKLYLYKKYLVRLRRYRQDIEGRGKP